MRGIPYHSGVDFTSSRAWVRRLWAGDSTTKAGFLISAGREAGEFDTGAAFSFGSEHQDSGSNEMQPSVSGEFDFGSFAGASQQEEEANGKDTAIARINARN